MSKRFAQPGETPSYQKHVLPLMSKVGCSGRSCHGSFQGQGGFRLSLFSYDFKADRDAMLGGDEPRINLKDPEKSLILLKPTMQEKHKGKKIFDKGSWEYNVIATWIKNGAEDDSGKNSAISHLEIQPAEIVFKKPGDKVQLRVLAHWHDGSIEDVTDITRFRTNDESVAKVDEKTGVVTSKGKGDTHIVAFYDNGVNPVPVMLPVSDQNGQKFPKIAASTKVDELVLAKLRKVGIVPSEICTDEEFLRRLSLDMCGTLPAPEEVRQFIADKSTDKRARKVEELLQRPTYAAWWTTKLCDITGNNANALRQVNRYLEKDSAEQWYAWIYKRVADNAPYDKIMEGIVLGIGRQPGQSYEDYCKEMISYFRTDSERKDFAERSTMPYFWARNNISKPQEKALAFAYTFLGVRLQCAECHKHPFDQWTQEDFKSFQAFFQGISYKGRGDYRRDPQIAKWLEDAGIKPEEINGAKLDVEIGKAIKAGKMMPITELVAREVPFRDVDPQKAKGKEKDKKALKGSARVITPKVLGGEEVVLSTFRDPRQPLMDWMRDRKNPYFAKAWVNRVWTNYFGVGIVEPADDLNLANPPSNAELLAYLAEGFIDSGWDMKWLQRQIVLSDAYQRSWKTNESNKLDKRNFSHALIRRLPAEVAMDALTMATASSTELARLHTDMRDRFIGTKAEQGAGRGGNRDYALGIFGRPDRVSNCDCERTSGPTLLQSIYTSNDQEVYGLMEKGGWVNEVTGGKTKLSLKIDKEKFKKLDKAEREEYIRREKLAAEQAAAAANKNRINVMAEPQKVVEELYLRTVSRLPNADEMSTAQHHLQEAKDPADAVRDLMWVMLNTKEFIVNH
jgi:hypothetical protein